MIENERRIRKKIGPLTRIASTAILTSGLYSGLVLVEAHSDTLSSVSQMNTPHIFGEKKDNVNLYNKWIKNYKMKPKSIDMSPPPPVKGECPWKKDGSEKVGDICRPGNRAKDFPYVSSKPKENGMYEATFFGCSDGNVDSEDGCSAAYEYLVPECNQPNKVLRGRDCQESLEWFGANTDQYGVNAKVEVSNPVNGKKVVIRLIDRGPACWTQDENAKFDMSYAAYKAIGFPDTVKVVLFSKKDSEKISLGPVS
jgi:hypothetical protein